MLRQDTTEHDAVARTPLRMLTRRDLRERKGIPFSRQRLHEKIKLGEFPPPDGKTTDAPTAPNFWFEKTIDDYLLARSRAFAAARVKQGSVDSN